MIWKGIKLECYRAFHNRWYIVSLAAATFIALLQFFTDVVPKTKTIAGIGNLDYPYSVFNTSLMFELSTFYPYLYFFAIILLASVPYAASYFTDIKDGYIKNISTRMNVKGYMAGKYIAVFLSAGSICAIPLIINQYLTAMVIPSLVPQRGTSQFAVILTGSVAIKLFYTVPYLYTLLYITIDFVMTGLFACLALTISRIANNRYMVMFFPFTVFVVGYVLTIYTSFVNFAPFNVMNAQQTYAESAGCIIAEMSALLLVTLVCFICTGGKKRDTL